MMIYDEDNNFGFQEGTEFYYDSELGEFIVVTEEGHYSADIGPLPEGHRMRNHIVLKDIWSTLHHFHHYGGMRGVDFWINTVLASWMDARQRNKLSRYVKLKLRAAGLIE